MTMTPEVIAKCREAYEEKYPIVALRTEHLQKGFFDGYQAAWQAAQQKVDVEAVNLDAIAKGSIIEYRSGWLAEVFDITDITWLGEVGAKRASARIWSRAEGREWYHTHRYDGVSRTSHEADIVRIVPTPPEQPSSKCKCGTPDDCVNCIFDGTQEGGEG